MNKVQINQLNMFETVSSTCDTNKSVWNVNATIKATVKKLSDGIDAINELSPEQQNSTSGITITKNKAKENMSEQAALAMAAGKAYAHFIGDDVLFKLMDGSKSDILTSPDNIADDKATKIYTTLLPLAAKLSDFGADAQSLSDLNKAIKTFSGFLGQPQQKAAEGVVVTGTLADHFAEVNDLLKNSLDPLMMQFKVKNIKFFNLYNESRAIQNIGHRKTLVISGFIYNENNEPQPHVLLTFTGTDAAGNAVSISKHTDAGGHFRFTRLHIGNYALSASLDGFVSVTENFSVTETQTITRDLVLVPIVPKN